MEALLAGWFVLPDSPAWLANPAYWIALLLLAARRPRAAGVVSAVTIVIALTTLRLISDPSWELRPEVGFVAWLTAAGTPLLAVLILRSVRPPGAAANGSS